MGLIDTQLQRARVRSPGLTVPFAGSTRAFNGSCEYKGFTLDAQTTAGSGIKVYDGQDNTGILIHVVAAPTANTVYTVPGEVVRCYQGLFIECLGTGQSGKVQPGGV
jgi:hypothetical protein